eukprot:scaffold1195_cov358-Prasinococcus_capsulatus_cf.AAC.10
MEDFPDNRDTLPVFVNDVPYMVGGRALARLVFRVDDKLYCTDAQSTAYQYPLTDAKISNSGPDGPTIKVPLDGTVYKLESGEVGARSLPAKLGVPSRVALSGRRWLQVLEWCPADNPLRGVLGMLKKDQPRVDLRTYKVELTERGTIIINITSWPPSERPRPPTPRTTWGARGAWLAVRRALVRKRLGRRMLRRSSVQSRDRPSRENMTKAEKHTLKCASPLWPRLVTPNGARVWRTPAQ